MAVRQTVEIEASASDDSQRFLGLAMDEFSSQFDRLWRMRIMEGMYPSPEPVPRFNNGETQSFLREFACCGQARRAGPNDDRVGCCSSHRDLIARAGSDGIHERRRLGKGRP